MLGKKIAKQKVLPTPQDLQKIILQKSKTLVATHGQAMKKALEDGQLEEALKETAKMLNELRTSDLTPKNYYDLYIFVGTYLQYLEMFFFDEQQHGRKMKDLYEVVQHAGNIVPRLYLLITVGSVYIKTKEGLAKHVLNDLVQMCKGVQHPTRGLFLRHYLAQSCRDKLPDKGTPYESNGGGNVFDAIAFALQNFKETVNLFSRLKGMNISGVAETPERERQELTILIGSNLVRLSQLDGVDENIYKENVLPKVLRTITQADDRIAQQYLMECVVQVFPDEYHLKTLDLLLSSIVEMKGSLDIKNLFLQLMKRLKLYFTKMKEENEEVFEKEQEERDNSQRNVVKILTSYISEIQDEVKGAKKEPKPAPKKKVEDEPEKTAKEGEGDEEEKTAKEGEEPESPKPEPEERETKETKETKEDEKTVGARTLSIDEMLSIELGLLELSLLLYPLKINFVNEILLNCANWIDINSSMNPLEESTIELIKKLLMTPLESYKSILVILKLDAFQVLLGKLPFVEKKSLASALVKSALDYNKKLSTWEQVDRLFSLIQPLIKSEGDSEKEDNDETKSQAENEAFDEEQNSAARLIHLMENDNTDIVFKMYATARQHFGKGGVKRMKHTLVPLVFAYLKLAKKIHEQKNGKKPEEGAAAAAEETDGDKKEKTENLIQNEKVFHYITEILEVLAQHLPKSALSLQLISAHAANNCKMDSTVYEFMSQALVLYEELESKIQPTFLVQIINTLTQLSALDEENFSVLSKRTCVFATKLLMKPDQCRATLHCSHLFWPLEAHAEVANPEKALECLQWSVRVVKSCMKEQQVPLFLEILNAYLYHFEKNNDKVTVDNLNKLLELLTTNIPKVDADSVVEETGVPMSVYYQNTIDFILKQKTANRKYEDVFMPDE